jgi:hypothetical protein
MSIVVTYKKDGSKQYFDDGVEISEAEFHAKIPDRGIEAGKAPIGHLPGCWPKESYAMGVDPTEIASARQNLAKMGVPTEFNPRTGDAILTSRKHRKQLAETVGLRDQSRHASWGDP